jgi:hypothetical protein
LQARSLIVPFRQQSAMRNSALNPIAVLVFLCLTSVVTAQIDTPQPSRNDPTPTTPNQGGKDTVPPATDPSLPTRGGKQEPSSKIEGTDTSAIFVNGVLAVPGAPPDSQTAPAKFTERTSSADQLPIAAYALRHLTSEQIRTISRKLHEQLALSGQVEAHVDAVVGSEISTDVALHGLQSVPEEVTSKLPQLRHLMFARVGSKILLVIPRLGLVLAVLD